MAGTVAVISAFIRTFTAHINIFYRLSVPCVRNIFSDFFNILFNISLLEKTDFRAVLNSKKLL